MPSWLFSRCFYHERTNTCSSSEVEIYCSVLFLFSLYTSLVDYLDGPITVNSMEGFDPSLGTEYDIVIEFMSRKVGKAWWIQDKTTGRYPQFESTVDYVLECYKEHGPFDGILGFSQGAGLGLFLVALQEKGDIATDFKFVISYSGFYPSDVTLQV